MNLLLISSSFFSYFETQRILLIRFICLFSTNLIFNYKLSQKVANTHNFIESLIALTKLENCIDQQENCQDEIAGIRFASFRCLSYIGEYGTEDVIVKLINEHQIIKTYVEQIGISGGIEKFNNVLVFQVLFNIVAFFHILRFGKQNFRGKKYYISKTEIVKDAEQQLEQEGEQEEVESSLFIYAGYKYLSILQLVKDTKNNILNIWKDESNMKYNNYY